MSSRNCDLCCPAHVFLSAQIGKIFLRRDFRRKRTLSTDPDSFFCFSVQECDRILQTFYADNLYSLHKGALRGILRRYDAARNTGGFCLSALKGGARAVINVDVSQPALNAAKAGVVHNRLDPGRCKFINRDVFEFLRQEVKLGHKYDVVILDPPKFVLNKSTLVTGARGYQDINRLGLKLVAPGGHLLTFSCSGLMTEELFQKIVADAALEAEVDAQIVGTLRQDRDHIVALPCPESFYLKGLDLLVG